MGKNTVLIPLALLGTASMINVVHAADKRPNLIFVLVDDLGWGALSENKSMYDYSQLNPEFIRLNVDDYTPQQAQEAAQKAIPTILSLCKDGTRFTDAYATANVSSPSRAGMLTSKYQERFGYYTNGEQSCGIPLTETLMPELIQKQGYATACIGKFHVGPEMNGGTGDCREGYGPTERGFDYYWGFNSHGTQYYDSKMLHRGTENVTANGFLTDEFTREALGFIDRSQGKPFMIYLAYNAVHGPLGDPAPTEYLSKFRYESKKLNNFYAYLNAVDEGIRKIMDKLKADGELENTMIVFVADNGAPGSKLNALPNNGPLNGFKGQTWQGGVRIPMVIKIPNGIKGGVSSQIVSTMDIFPTFMDIAGIETPQRLVVDGRSLVPILKGDKKHQVRDRMVWMGQNAENWGVYNIKDQAYAPGSFMVRKDNWTLRYDTKQREFYLFDLSTDLGERVNLADKNPDKVAQISDIFNEWFAQMKTPMNWKESLWKGLCLEAQSCKPQKYLFRVSDHFDE